MASAYCTSADIYSRIPRGSLPNEGRLVDSVDSGTEILTLDQHGFSSGTPLVLRAEGGGSLPAPLVAGTTYYALPVTENTFQVSATDGGAAINLTTAGSRIIVTAARPLDPYIEAGAAEIDESLPAHAVPLEAPYPASVVNANAWLAIENALAAAGQDVGVYKTMIDNARDRLRVWFKGIPIRGAVEPPRTGLAVTAVSSGGDPRGWSPVGDTLP